MRLSKGILSLLLIVMGAGLLAEEKAPVSAGPLYRFLVKGTIGPVVKDYLRDGFEKAKQASAIAVLIQLDTPGGLLDATREIVQDILNVPIPVIVYVSPRGARAASAGVFITISADVAAMAPQTHLGAAHPVSIGGGMPGMPRKDKEKEGQGNEEKGRQGDKEKGGQGETEKGEKRKSSSVMEEKAVSDTAAYARTLASSKGRNADWAERAVRESDSLTSEEALKNNVIDLVAKDEKELLTLLNGREIKKNDRTFILQTDNIEIVNVDMSLVRKWLHVLAHPNVAYILLMLGFYGLIYEFSSPGVGLGAVAGVICLLLAFFALQILPLNYTGLALLVVGITLIVSDLFVPSGGILTLGGIASFAAGSLMLFDASDANLRVSLELIIGTVAATVAFVLFVVKKIIQSRKIKPLSGTDGLTGETGEVREGGLIYVHGEYWTAECAEPLAPGDKVQVKQIKGNRLLVDKLSV